MYYLHDGTFDGLLTCIYYHYYENKAEGIYSRKVYQEHLFEQSLDVSTNPYYARKVYNGIIQNISYETLKHIYYVFLSNEYEKDTLILKYIELGFRQGKEVNCLLTHEKVYPIHRLFQKVSMERHRFLGLLRFMDIDGILYGAIEPDHDIVTLLVSHFADRLKNQRFIIHDQKRNKAVIFEEKEWYLTDFVLPKNISISNRELFYQELWKKYFQQISIENRVNPKLQRQFVPVRYRNHLPEFTTLFRRKRGN